MFFFYVKVHHHGDVWRHLVVGTESSQEPLIFYQVSIVLLKNRFVHSTVKCSSHANYSSDLTHIMAQGLF